MKVAVTILVSCVAGLLALGMVMLYSASMAQVGARYLTMQLVWCALGLAACVITTLVDYRRGTRIGWWPLGFVVVLLCLVWAGHLAKKFTGRAAGSAFTACTFSRRSLPKPR